MDHIGCCGGASILFLTKIENKRSLWAWVLLTPVGVATGRCVLFNETVKTCEVAAWCPVEYDARAPE